MRVFPHHVRSSFCETNVTVEDDDGVAAGLLRHCIRKSHYWAIVAEERRRSRNSLSRDGLAVWRRTSYDRVPGCREMAWRRPGPPAVVRQRLALAHVRADRRRVCTAQKLLGHVLVGPVVFCLYLPQHTRIRVSTLYSDLYTYVHPTISE